MEITHTIVIGTEDKNKRLAESEIKIWNKVKDIAYVEGKHPDEVYTGLVI